MFWDGIDWGELMDWAVLLTCRQFAVGNTIKAERHFFFMTPIPKMVCLVLQ